VVKFFSLMLIFLILGPVELVRLHLGVGEGDGGPLLRGSDSLRQGSARAPPGLRRGSLAKPGERGIVWLDTRYYKDLDVHVELEQDLEVDVDAEQEVESCTACLTASVAGRALGGFNYSGSARAAYCTLWPSAPAHPQSFRPPESGVVSGV
jgi:hypothetical protein